MRGKSLPINGMGEIARNASNSLNLLDTKKTPCATVGVGGRAICNELGCKMNFSYPMRIFPHFFFISTFREEWTKIVHDKREDGCRGIERIMNFSYLIFYGKPCSCFKTVLFLHSLYFYVHRRFERNNATEKKTSEELYATITILQMQPRRRNKNANKINTPATNYSMHFSVESFYGLAKNADYTRNTKKKKNTNHRIPIYQF